MPLVLALSLGLNVGLLVDQIGERWPGGESRKAGARRPDGAEGRWQDLRRE